MELSTEELKTYLKMMTSDMDLALEMWPTLGIPAKDLISVMQEVAGCLLADRDPTLLEPEELRDEWADAL